MSPSLRVAVIVLVGSIVAAASVGVYLMFASGDGPARPKLGSLENYIRAAEIKPTTPISFLDADGKKMTLEHFRGQIVVLNLWATWCTPCVAEMPALDRLQDQLKDVGVTVVALSIDRGGPPVVKEFFAQNGVKHLQVYVDPSMHAQSDLSVFGLPTTILIDRKGNERGRLVGPADWNEAEAADLVLGINTSPP